MSLIADALKRAQEQRAAGSDSGARRLLTPSGPLRVRGKRRRELPRSVVLAGLGLAASVVLFGLVVVLSPWAQVRAEAAVAATAGGAAVEPSEPATRVGEEGLPELALDAGAAGSPPEAAIGAVADERAEIPAAPHEPGPVGGAAAGLPGALGSAAVGVPSTAEGSSFRLSLSEEPRSADPGLRALAAQQRGDLAGAAVLYRRALEERPSDPQLHNNLGTVYRARAMPAEAHAAFEAAIAAEPGYAPAWNNLGLVLGGLGRAEEAEEAFREALRLDPANRGAGVNLANAYAERGLYDQALALLRDVLREAPALPEAHYAMARLLERTGDPEGARRHYGLFLETAGGRFDEVEARVRDHLGGS